MSVRTLACLVALAIAGCHARGIYDPASKPLDKALFYVEKPTYGAMRDRPLSSETSTTVTDRVPHPALVDMDSQILIKVDRDHVAATSDQQFLAADGEHLLAKKQRLVRALEQVRKFLELRAETILAFSGDDREAFQNLKAQFGDSEVKLVDELRKEFPKGTPEGARLTRAANEDKKRPYDGVMRFLQAEIDDLESKYKAIDVAAKSRRTALQLVAFLDREGQERVWIHLEGYDTLPEGKLQARDRWGLNLSADEMARLKAQMDASVELAAEAEKVREGQKSVKEALQALRPKLTPEFEEIVKEIESAAEKLDPAALKARLERTRQLAVQFWAALGEAAQTMDDKAKEAVRGLPKRFADHFEGRSESLLTLVDLFMSAKDISERWKGADPGSLPQLIMDSVAFLGRLRAAIENAEPGGDTALVDIRKFLEGELKTLADEARDQLVAVLKGPEGEPLRKDLSAWAQDIESIAMIAKRVRDLVGTAAGPRPEAEIQVPEAFKVPVEDLQDTFIDLKRTGRMPGDLITVRATRFENNQETGTTTASFEVQRFGWYAKLSPAVVLVKPDQLSGHSNDFEFAPTLSWMHHYAPRAEDTGLFAGPLRTFQPAIGMHAAFLSFPSDDSDVQIGLGATISFWEDRLQFGAGYNLMADSADDGRVYYFIGTDLIGLLQTVGIVKKK